MQPETLLAFKAVVPVQPGGLVEVQIPELQPGVWVEVIVLVEPVVADAREATSEASRLPEETHAEIPDPEY